MSSSISVSSGKNINSASKVVNWIIVDILKFINIMLSLAEFYLGGWGERGYVPPPKEMFPP